MDPPSTVRKILTLSTCVSDVVFPLMVYFSEVAAPVESEYGDGDDICPVPELSKQITHWKPVTVVSAPAVFVNVTAAAGAVIPQFVTVVPSYFFMSVALAKNTKSLETT